ncbi:transporter substrate-binding domain-containing protein [Tumebacillus sp. ITR2]|uniref:Transporter substrate-binding domain-containing protein n=1 Tax=Tumebacillus amylolyticus TaxID=2801339 RepID=A0ABS1J8C0_9BACL|nr:transporter substrate-binding domain-containing protein [Tumebacillus amylolyticus]MBL0386460.1 transporter substrate-binding domain-containing protein [Tumebacillus amylolyticus]
MKNTKLKALTLLSVTAALAMTVGCGSNSASDNTGSSTSGQKKLVLMTSADYPPYESHKTDGGSDEIVGFDIDIAKAITKNLGYDLEIKDVDFNGLLPALQAKQADLVMAGMTPKPERLQNADFSDIYYEAKNTIVEKKGANLKTAADLKGKKVGVQLGSIQEGDAKKMDGLNIVSLNKIGDIVQELKSGRIDAAIIEDTVAKGYTAANTDLEFNTITSTEPAGSAVAFPKGSALVGDFNKELKKLKDSGELDNLIKKWFDTNK